MCDICIVYLLVSVCMHLSTHIYTFMCMWWPEIKVRYLSWAHWFTEACWLMSLRSLSVFTASITFIFSLSFLSVSSLFCLFCCCFCCWCLRQRPVCLKCGLTFREWLSITLNFLYSYLTLKHCGGWPVVLFYAVLETELRTCCLLDENSANRTKEPSLSVVWSQRSCFITKLSDPGLTMYFWLAWSFHFCHRLLIGGILGMCLNSTIPGYFH